MMPIQKLRRSENTIRYLRRQFYLRMAFAAAATVTVWLLMLYATSPAHAHGLRHHHHVIRHHIARAPSGVIACNRFGCRGEARAVIYIHKRAKHARAEPIDANGNASMIKVSTAANIDIVVASSFATKIEGFIADLKARGYQPRHIHCFARGGHVRGSLHYRGEACDFDQRGWGLTAQAMYHVADLARKWGLRDGCTFRDCGHIDSGGMLAGRHYHRHYAFSARTRL